MVRLFCPLLLRSIRCSISYGFEPAETRGDVENPVNGVLRLTPWRIELNDYVGAPETLVWRGYYQ